ncbi:MAG TPA: ZIP family metal transporter [Syntrophomonadaceae bacterium]|nr:ZIP family metal transporter [Syntrophomonadaceae bacterium]
MSILAGGCTAVGAVFLFAKRNWSNASLAFYLGLASGVMVAVVVFDMMPSALLYSGWLQGLLGFGLGLLVLRGVSTDNNVSHRNSLVGLGYLIMLGIALHDLPEGMAIALGSEMKARTGFVIALAIGIHNIPEGMAIAAPLLMGGLSRLNILFKTLLIGIITPFGTLIGFWALALLPGFLPLLLGLASGIMIYLVISQLWPQASARDRKARWWGFLLGMAIILLATFI